jgi:short-subunit dehydrogenase
MNNLTYSLITGASAGIGKAMAAELASRKYNVLLIALPGTGLPAVVEEINRKYPVLAHGLELDLTSTAAAQRILEWCRSNHYRVNMLINNAGFGNFSSLEKSDPAELTGMMILNNQALVVLTHVFLLELKENAAAHILNVGSLASFMPIPNKSVYAATKSFVYSFSSALRYELLPHKIYVSCLCPGATLTNKTVRDGVKAIGVNKRMIQSAEDVAREAVEGMLQRKYRIIPGKLNRVLYTIRQLLPDAWVGWILYKLFRKTPEASPVQEAHPELSSRKLVRMYSSKRLN